MRGLHQWFLDGPNGRSIFPYAWGIVLIQLVLVEGGAHLAEGLSLMKDFSADTIDLREQVRRGGFLYTLGTLPIAAFLEEGIFRCIPLAFTAFLLGMAVCRRWGFLIMIGVAIASSIVFGLAHGGLGNIFVQGVAGLVLAAVFLKWSSLGANSLRGLFASTVVHTFYNSVFVFAGLVSIVPNH